MDLQCLNQSAGAINQLYGMLIQTILLSQCSISPENMWPDDYGTVALKQGFYSYCKLLVFPLSCFTISNTFPCFSRFE